MTGIIPESIKCKLCGEVCKRGVSLGCCGTIACRSCATKSITTTRICWNVDCKKTVTTSQLVNDENLRQRVDKYSKGELKDNDVQGGGGDVRAENDKSVSSSSSNNIEKVANSEEKHDQPPVKKFKNNNNFTNGGGGGGCYNCNNQVTLNQMRERNAEFDRCLLPAEKNCQELRVGAQLELMYEFDSSSAVCLGCSGNIGGENLIIEHLTLKRSSEFGYLKTILKQADDNNLKNMISKAVKSEFLYAEKQIFPCKVEY